MARPKGSTRLTPKMKDFCHAYIRLHNGTQAYMEAYDTDNAANARNEASKLLRRDDVTAYLNELNKPTVNKIVNEREKKRDILWNRIEKCIEKDDETAIARYMDILNKMDAEYVNINRNVDDSAETLAALSTEDLKKLLDEPIA